jgi:hypothetical protein
VLKPEGVVALHGRLASSPSTLTAG